MARERKLGDFVYNYILDHLKTVHELANSPNIVKYELPHYKNISEMIRGVLEDPIFFDVEEYSNGKKPKEGQMEISKGTIRSAINRLIDDKKIANVDGYFEYIPNIDSEFNIPPLLNIAPQTQITINIPESYIVLSVCNGLATGVAEYLSAQFYRGDIIFIPIGNHIICIGTLPQSVIEQKGKKETHPESNCTNDLLNRILSVLHTFDIQYPQFSYGSQYETAYTSSRNPEINAQIREMAYDREKKRFSFHRYIMLMKMYKAHPWLEEYETLSSIFGPLTADHDGISDEEYDVMDSAIMDCVDDEFLEYE